MGYFYKAGDYENFLDALVEDKGTASQEKSRQIYKMYGKLSK